MRVLQVGHSDLIGKRFNGYDLNKYLRSKKIQCQNCVHNKLSDDDNTWELYSNKNKKYIDFINKHIEKKVSLQSLLTPWAFRLLFDKRFKSSDLIHYHVIHGGYFNISTLPFLTNLKPSVWTLHDPWAMTGHCIHPYDCDKWKTGCGGCPNLNNELAISTDRTALMWKIKKYIYYNSKIDIIVASKWMLYKAQNSPLLSKFNLHYIPFGLDLDVFRPFDSDAAKKELGVIPGSIVICFRATISKFKGISYIKNCLETLKTEKPICLLTFNERGLMDEFRGKYQIIDMGWVHDDKLIVKAYNAADIFLMPSTAEAFGMMAMEAMACGKPVITFDSTSLSEVIMPPKGGISVAQGDDNALLAAIKDLIENNDMRYKIGKSALKLAQEHYNIINNVNKHIELYNDVIVRRRIKNK
jgi:glycosyltransferase involved in cell wall biosynthesis